MNLSGNTKKLIVLILLTMKITTFGDFFNFDEEEKHIKTPHPKTHHHHYPTTTPKTDTHHHHYTPKPHHDTNHHDDHHHDTHHHDVHHDDHHHDVHHVVHKPVVVKHVVHKPVVHTHVHGEPKLQYDFPPVINYKGPVGHEGPRGPDGEVGPNGYTGPRGLQGDTGVDGETGDVGHMGPQGCDGEDGADATGPAEKGDKGETGDAGDDFECKECKDEMWAFAECMAYNKKDFGIKCFKQTMEVKDCYTRCLSNEGNNEECVTENEVCISSCEALNDETACSHSTLTTEIETCKNACQYIKDHCNRRCNCINRKKTFCPEAQAGIECAAIYPNVYQPYKRYNIMDDDKNSITTDNSKYAKYSGSNDKHYVMSGHSTPRIVLTLTENGAYKIQYCDANSWHPNLYFLDAVRESTAEVTNGTCVFTGFKEILDADTTGVNFGLADREQTWAFGKGTCAGHSLQITFRDSQKEGETNNNLLCGHKLFNYMDTAADTTQKTGQIVVSADEHTCWTIVEC